MPADPVLPHYRITHLPHHHCTQQPASFLLTTQPLPLYNLTLPSLKWKEMYPWQYKPIFCIKCTSILYNTVGTYYLLCAETNKRFCYYYYFTLWIWIQLGPVFSHFVDLDPTWVLIQPILVTALPCHKTLPFTPSKWPLLKVLFRYSLARLKGHLAVNRESILYASWPCSPTLSHTYHTITVQYTTTCQFPANHPTPYSIYPCLTKCIHGSIYQSSV